MFRFGFKKKWRSNKESKEPEQPANTNGIKLLTFRTIDNEFTSKPLVPECSVPRQTRVKRNVMEVFRQSYPNFPTRNGEINSYEPVQFQTVQFPKEISNDTNKTNSSFESEEKSTLIFMTEDHGDTNRKPQVNEMIDEDFGVNLGAAFQQRRTQVDEFVASVDQEELEDICGVKKEPMQEENATELRSNSDKNSIDDKETVEIENEISDLDEDNYRVHILQHVNDAASMVSYQSGDTLLDTASVLQEERPKFRFDDYYNFGESESEEKVGENFQININNEQDEQQINFEESVHNNQSERVEKRVMFDVSDNEENIRKPKITGEIITTPQRKETLEDIKLKPGYSLQASALFFREDNNDGNDSETSA